MYTSQHISTYRVTEGPAESVNTKITIVSLGGSEDPFSLPGGGGILSIFFVHYAGSPFVFAMLF